MELYEEEEERPLFKFRQLVPKVPSNIVFHQYEEIFYKAVMQLDPEVVPSNLQVQVETNEKDEYQADGNYHYLDLILKGVLDDPNIYVYCAQAILISNSGNYDFCFRAKLDNEDHWTYSPTQPVIKGILRMTYADKGLIARALKEEPSFSPVFNNIFVGNQVTLDYVPRLQFKYVLNVDEDIVDPSWTEVRKPSLLPIGSGLNNLLELEKKKIERGSESNDIDEDEDEIEKKDMNLQTESEEKQHQKKKSFEKFSIDRNRIIPNEFILVKSKVNYLKVGLHSIIDKPIEGEKIKEAVSWIHKNSNDKQLLIVSTHGFRRAMNIALAFYYAFSNSSFDKCVEVLKCRRHMYITPGLKETLEELYSKK